MVLINTILGIGFLALAVCTGSMFGCCAGQGQGWKDMPRFERAENLRQSKVLAISTLVFFGLGLILIIGAR